MHARVSRVIIIFLATVTVAQSRRWFAPEVSCWITQKKVPASWEDAQRRCESRGAVLASPLNMPLFNYMQSLIDMHNHTTAYFIGTRANRSDDGQKMHYVSVEGRRLSEMPRAVFDTIERLDLEQGDCLSMDRYGIGAVSCWDHLPYICYSNETTECGSAPAQTATTTTSAPLPSTTIPPATSAAPAPPPNTTTSAPLPSTTIPPGYTYKSATGSFYKVYRIKVSWYEASFTCASEGAHLVVLNDAEEARIVAGVVWGTVSDHGSTWIGLRDSRPGGTMEWRTVRGEPLSEVYHEWLETRPRNDSVWICGGLSSDKQLYDAPCYDKYYITCEISQ